MKVARIRIATAALLGAALVLVVPATAYATPGDGRSGLQNFKSGLVLEPAASVNGALVHQEAIHLSGGDFISAENWIVSNVGGFVRFRNVNTGMNLGVDGASTSAGAVIIQARPDGGINQDWTFLQSSYPSGVRAIQNRKSHLCIGISGASTAPGGQAAQFSCDGSVNQGWRLVDH